MNTEYDIIIIGSGPAGYAAAIYTSRALLKTMIISGMQPGGQLTTTTEVDNYPGFPKGIKGPELVEEMKVQAMRFGTEVVSDEAMSVEGMSGRFTVGTADVAYHARAVIIATGASAKTLGIPSEKAFWGKGVSACATCDGFFFRGKDVAVIGGGDTAMEEAHFLTTLDASVTIIHRRAEFRASPIMLKRAKKNPKIRFVTDVVIEEFFGDATLQGIRIKDTKSGVLSEVQVQGAFLAIGHTPNTAFLKGTVTLDDKGYIKRVMPKTPLDPHTKASEPGIFAAGDCSDPRYRQAAVAAGSGVMAALDAQRWLEEQ